VPAAVFVVSKNGVSAGINGSASANQKDQKAKCMNVGNAHFHFFVSRIIISMSQLPTPGPPRLDRDGRMRFWRPCDGIFEDEGSMMRSL
jgi:hypothetical protein